MPHADAERELRYAEALTQGYQRAAAEVVFSYAKQGEESHQQASPLLNHLTPIEDHTQSETAIGSYARQQVSQPSEWYHTDRAPQVSAVERSRLKGGSQILRNQAINPMAAFLIHRLGARQPTSMHQGLTPQQRGQMLHEVLANLWNQWQRQSVLLQLSDAELQSAVHQEVEKQALALKHREPGYFSDRYIALEIERLSVLIQGWLEQEKLRPGFTVHTTEQSLETDIEGLPLTLRLDRLDLLLVIVVPVLRVPYRRQVLAGETEQRLVHVLLRRRPRLEAGRGEQSEGEDGGEEAHGSPWVEV